VMFYGKFLDLISIQLMNTVIARMYFVTVFNVECYYLGGGSIHEHVINTSKLIHYSKLHLIREA